MTISTTTRTAGPFTGTGVIVAYPFAFKTLLATDLAVTSISAAGVLSTLVLTTNYAVSLNADQDASPGGTVTPVVALAVGATLSITTAAAATQTASLTNLGGFFPKVIEGALDRLTILIQQILSGASRITGVLQYPVGDLASGVIPAAASRANQLLGFDSSGNPITVAPVSGSAAALALDLANTSDTAKNASLVGWLRAMTGAVAATVYKWINWQNPCIFEWMTTAQIADYQARTAVANMASALDLTAPIQAALDASYAAGQSLYFPPGAAKVTGLQVPTNSALYEDRGDAWCMYGAGAPQPFVRYPRSGTLLISETNVPVLRYQQRRAMPTAGGNTHVRGIRFEQRNAAATSAVVLWDSMSEDAEFSNNVILQFGTGNGFETTYQIKGNIYRNFVMFGGYFTATRSAAGIGFNIPSAGDSGMLTVRKNSARSFFWGYVHGDGTNDSSGALFEQNESSDCVNGMWNKANCTGATFFKSYTEGITGTCIKDEGTMTTISGGMHYLGFSIGIDASAVNNYGTVIEANYLETAGPNCTLIKVGSGGPNKTVRSNHLLFSTSGGVVVGVVGIEISSIGPRLDIGANAFLPRGAWTGGAGTVKVSNLSTLGITGLVPINQGADLEIPTWLRAGITLQDNDTLLTETAVVANVLTLTATNVVNITAGAARTVNSMAQSATFTGGSRVVHIVTGNNNVSFTDAAPLYLNGAFTGSATGGILTLLVRDETGTLVGREIARTSF